MFSPSQNRKKGFTPLEAECPKALVALLSAGRPLTTGFTLLEVIGAIFVISVGIIGIFSLTIQTMSLLDISSDRLIAVYLAQEGIEVVRNIRDANLLKGEDWDKDIDEESSYKLDFESLRFPDNRCNLAIGNYLKYASAKRAYNCWRGTITKFKRQITVTKPNDYTLNVVVKVEWFSKNRNHQITAQENLYDWQ